MGQVGAAGVRGAGPALGVEHLGHLLSDRAWAPGHVAPAVARDGLALHDGVIVPAEITKALVSRVCFATVQFEDGCPLRIADVPVPVAASWSRFGPVAFAAWQAVRAFHVVRVPLLECGADAGLDVGPHLLQQASPAMPFALAQAERSR